MRLAKRIILLAVFAAAAPLAVAAPIEPGIVPTDARWVVHVDLDALRASTIGSALMQDVSQRREGRDLDKVSGVVGFDVKQNLKDATLYGSGFTRDATAIFVNLAGGTGNLEGLMLAAPGYESVEEGGRTVHSFIAKDRNAGDARLFVTMDQHDAGTRIVAAYDPEILRTALAQADGKGDPKPEAAAEGGNGGTVLYARLEDIDPSRLDPNGQHSGVLRLVRDLTLELGEADGRVNLRAQAAVVDEQKAEQLRQLVQGLLAMTQFANQNDPKAATLAELAQRAKVERTGATVSLSLDEDAQKVLDEVRKLDQMRPHHPHGHGQPGPGGPPHSRPGGFGGGAPHGPPHGPPPPGSPHSPPPPRGPHGPPQQ